MLQGGGSNKRQLILSIALDVIQSIGYLDIDTFRITRLMSKLEILADFRSIIEEVTNCSFLYLRREMIGTWFSMVYMDVNKFSWLQYLLDAFCDGLWLLKLGHVSNFTRQSHEKEIENAVKNEIIAPLCRDIETDLRLHVHSTHLKGSVHVNPTKTGVRNLTWFLQMKPLQLPFKFIDIKSHVEIYLNSAFYNHTAMSIYNWKIYSEMRQLAELKYGLVLDDIHLPEHSLDHSLDFAVVLQNLHKFAEDYSYSVNNQIFIEKVPDGQGRKTLRVIGVEHFASMIGSCGRGAVSTALDSVFKFIMQKIAALAELLQDNFFRSQLSKESKFWKNDKGTINKYPFVRAQELNITLGKPSQGNHEFSFLERLRWIITEVGTVLGLVRILRAGGSRYASNISQFVYGPRGTTSFMEMSQKMGFIDGKVMAGRIMDLAMDNKYQSEECVNCFPLLISAFSKELQGNDHLHLRDFFLIVPALTINFVDCKIHYKDKMLRRGRDYGNPIIRDDGFMMGIAYILKVTEQEKQFDGLHWFACASMHFEEEVLSLEESRSVEQRRGSSLTGFKLWGQAAKPISTEAQKGIDKLKRYQKEMEIIQCCLNAARAIMS